jgi:hypothetical protein
MEKDTVLTVLEKGQNSWKLRENLIILNILDNFTLSNFKDEKYCFSWPSVPRRHVKFLILIKTKNVWSSLWCSKKNNDYFEIFTFIDVSA